jgi:hypothetical protein
MTAQVIHVREMFKFPNAVYIGREYRHRGHDFAESPLRNPFTMSKGVTRADVIADYGRLVDSLFELAGTGSASGIEFVNALIAARNKPLACWCRKSTAAKPECHGDVVLEILDRYSDDELRAMIGSRP